jgi:uncharacterized membrane protein YraQ (UPF0718 family)
MQRTRLSTLIETLGQDLFRWLLNPWRKLSVLIISLLFGYFFGVAIAAYAGQAADQDLVVAAILVILAELTSRLVYGRYRTAPEADLPFLLEALNGFKVGVMYALAVEAFKLGS